ncbi:hypothetical protein LPJ61_004336 [Coemansia biformis]|uniref:Uncharacterized protein n=1 Tax=Coemansia biformis TaxID=1286918 RepID=A0A9W7Y9Q2_9FUNG|nr:hypothetical protein LPJ61_004336 [Coemansia biformis]
MASQFVFYFNGYPTDTVMDMAMYGSSQQLEAAAISIMEAAGMINRERETVALFCDPFHGVPYTFGQPFGDGFMHHGPDGYDSDQSTGTADSGYFSSAGHHAHSVYPVIYVASVAAPAGVVLPRARL